MAMTISNPHAENFQVGIGQPVLVEGKITSPETLANSVWEVNEGFGFQQFASGTLSAVYTSSPFILNRDVSGNSGTDSCQLRFRDTVTGISDVFNFSRVFGAVALSETIAEKNPEAVVDETGDVPHHNQRAGGAPATAAPSHPMDQDNISYDEETARCENQAVPELPGDGDCGCPSGAGAVGEPQFAEADAMETVPGPTTGGAGVVETLSKYTNYDDVAISSRVRASLDGKIQTKSGCGRLPTRGETLDLGVYYTSPSGGLGTSELVAGSRRMFGWQVRLIQDTTGNVALYWGNRKIEGWRSTDGGSTFVRPKGSFGTLTKQGDGSFTRTTKDCVYFDFDSNGRLQKIKDRSSDGNTIYYNYNGSNQVIRITGPGMRMKPYFTYDGNGRVNSMTLEASNPTNDRVTYYDYDASGQMNVMEGPESCLTYFDYNAGNLSVEINPDNYATYFEYTFDFPARIQTIHLPEDAAVYFAYDDTSPWGSRKEKGCPHQYYQYNWGGNKLSGSWSGSIDSTLFTYCPDSKVESSQGADGNVCYYEWDDSGQMESRYCCGEGDKATYYTYGGCGTVTSRKDPLGRVTYWNYNGNSLQTNWIDALGNTTYFERDSFGKITSKKDRRGNLIYYTFDTQGRHTSTKWADGSVRYYDYNEAGELEVLIDEAANVSYYDRDKRGRITAWKDFAGNTTQYAYDNRSNRTIEIDRRSNAWYWEYDGLSRNTVQRTALLNTTYMNYDVCGLMTSTVDPRGNPTYFYYFDQKRLKARENALQQITYFEYTSAGQLLSTKDPRGCADYFTYDCHHRRTSQKNGEGNVTYFDYDCLGNQDVVTDPRGFVTYTNYDQLYRVASTRNPLDQQDYFYFDEESNITTREDALQRRTYYYFDARDRQFAAEDAIQNRTYFTFDSRSNQNSTKDARGNVTYLYFDELSRQFSTRDALNNLTYLEFDAESNQIATKDARSNTTYFEFDNDRRQTEVRDPLGNLTTTGYDAAGNATNVVDSRSNPSYFYYDKLNRQFSNEDAKRARTYFGYDLSGNQESVKDPLGRTNYFDYDCAQRNSSTKDPLGNVTTVGYDASGNRHLVTDAGSNTSYFDFDALGRVQKQKSAVGGVTTFGFDMVGNQTSVVDPLSRNNYYYFDSLNRLEASEDGLQKRTYFEYDAVGNQVSVKDPRSNSQYFTFDVLDRRNSLKTETSDVWYFNYDGVGNLEHQINPKLAVTYWEYTKRNEKESQKDPLERTWYWEYDAVGNNISLKDGKGNETTYTFDSVNLAQRIDYPDATKHYFEYNDAREQTAMADPTGRTEWTYDDNSRPTIRLNPGSLALYYVYDAMGNRTELKDPDGKLFYYEYDAANRLDIISSGTYSGNIAYYEYNLADQIVLETRKNGTITYHGYDDAGRVSLIQHRKSGGTQIERYTFTRDDNGNITLNLRGSDSASVYWNYDEANRITKEAWRSSVPANIYGWLFDYDAAGNRTYKNDTEKSSTTYWEYDLGDQLTKQRSGTPVDVYFEFDDNGNLSIEHDVSAGRTYYDYNDRNLLVRVDFPGATPTNYFEFNALSERVRKDDSTGGKKYTWDGIDVVVEKNLSDTTTQRLVKGFTPIEGIGAYVLQDVSGTVIYPHKNQVGTTEKTTDSAEAVDGAYEYDAWGNAIEQSETTPQSYRLNQKEQDSESLLSGNSGCRVHFPLRTFQPHLGRFVQIDKMVFGPSYFPESLRGVAGRGEVFSPIGRVHHSYSIFFPQERVDPVGLQEQETTPHIPDPKDCKVCGPDISRWFYFELLQNIKWVRDRIGWWGGRQWTTYAEKYVTNLRRFKSLDDCNFNCGPSGSSATLCGMCVDVFKVKLLILGFTGHGVFQPLARDFVESLARSNPATSFVMSNPRNRAAAAVGWNAFPKFAGKAMSPDAICEVLTSDPLWKQTQSPSKRKCATCKFPYLGGVTLFPQLGKKESGPYVILTEGKTKRLQDFADKFFTID